MNRVNRRNRIFIYGPPGAGKTTVSQILAGRLNLPCDDLDQLIEKEAGFTIAQLFEREGETGFRRREAEQFRVWIDSRDGILSLGGGTLLDPACRELAQKSGNVICLTASVSELQSRMQSQRGLRPLINGADLNERLGTLIKTRADHYAGFQTQIQTEGRSPEEIVLQIQAAIGWFSLPNGENGCQVRIVNDGLRQIQEYLDISGFSGKIGLISDSNVMPIYGEQIASHLAAAGIRPVCFSIPAGEAHKNMDTVMRLWDDFLKSGLDRGSLILSVGGGVVSDIAGFAASTFMRGIPWAAVPTTLLAMVDAGLGGKTGVDLPSGKNLVGTFYPPEKVLIDPSVLSSLPVDEWRCGLAETVKHAVLGDAGLFEQCRKLGDFHSDFYRYGLDNWLSLVKRSTAVKVGFVCQDPYEKGVRAALNLGHTVGHAVELVSNFQIRHGEAVSIGLVLEARLAERMGLSENGLANEIAGVLVPLGLPVSLPYKMDPDRVLNAVASDKKRKNGQIKYALPVRIGGYVLEFPPTEIIIKVLKGEL